MRHCRSRKTRRRSLRLPVCSLCDPPHRKQSATRDALPSQVGKSDLKRGAPRKLASPAPRSYEWLLPVLDCPRPTPPKRNAEKNGALSSCFYFYPNLHSFPHGPGRASCFLTARPERNGNPEPPSDPCLPPSTKVCHVLSIYMPGGNTRSIPAVCNSFRLAECQLVYARQEIHPSIARRCRQDPSLQTGWRLWDAHRPDRDRASCGSYPARERRLRPTGCPKDRGSHPCVASHNAIPIRAAGASSR